MFVVALFIIFKIQKQPKCPWMNEWIKKMGYVYTMEYYSAIKKLNLALWDNTHGPWEYYGKWNKSDRESQIPYDLTYM